MNKCKSQCVYKGCSEYPMYFANFTKFHRVCFNHLSNLNQEIDCSVCYNKIKVLASSSKIYNIRPEGSETFYSIEEMCNRKPYNNQKDSIESNLTGNQNSNLMNPNYQQTDNYYPYDQNYYNNMPNPNLGDFSLDSSEKHEQYSGDSSNSSEKFCLSCKQFKEQLCEHQYCNDCIWNLKCLNCRNCSVCYKNIESFGKTDCINPVCPQCYDGKFCLSCKKVEPLCEHKYCHDCIWNLKCSNCRNCRSCYKNIESFGKTDCIHPVCSECQYQPCNICLNYPCFECRMPKISSICSNKYHYYCKKHSNDDCINCKPCKGCHNYQLKPYVCIHGYCDGCMINCKECLCAICYANIGKFKTSNKKLICENCISPDYCESCYFECSECKNTAITYQLNCIHRKCQNCLNNNCSVCLDRTTCIQCNKKSNNLNHTCIHGRCFKCLSQCCVANPCQNCNSITTININVCGHLKCLKCKEIECLKCFQSQCSFCGAENNKKFPYKNSKYYICELCKSRENRNLIIKCKKCNIDKEPNRICSHFICLECNFCEECNNYCIHCNTLYDKICEKCKFKSCNKCFNSRRLRIK
jgi:hypothetical protein